MSGTTEYWLVRNGDVDGTLQAQLNSLGAAETSVLATVVSHTASIATLNSQVTTNTSNITSNTSSITSQGTSITTLNSQVARLYPAASDVGGVTATLVASSVISGIMTSIAAVGKGYPFTLINLNGTNAATILAGTGVTLVGNMVVALSTSGNFYLYYSNVSNGTQAVTIYRR
jgi:hypothetical protein